MSIEEIPLTEKDLFALAKMQGKSIDQWCATSTCPGAPPASGQTTPMSAPPSRTVADRLPSIGGWPLWHRCSSQPSD